MEFIQQNIWLVMLAVASGTMLLATTYLQGKGSRVTAAEATLLINREDAQVLDVRDSGEFARGHLHDAVNIPAGKIGERAEEVDKLRGKPLIVCCETGVRSAKVVAELQKKGFEKVFNLDGGVGAWERANLPLTKKSGRK